MYPPLRHHRFAVTLFLIGMIGLFTACGESSSSKTNGGRTAILLTDKHEEEITDPHGQPITSAKEVWVEISGISLKPKEGKWITVFSGPPNKSVDLLTLHGTADLVAWVDLPPGRYGQARLTIERAHFIDKDNQRHDLIIPSRKITLKFKHDLLIAANENTQILFDFVPGKSIHLVETGSGKFILRPVIHVKVIVIGEEKIAETVRVRARVAVNCDDHRLALDLHSGRQMTVDFEEAVILRKEGGLKQGAVIVINRKGGSDDDDHGDERRVEVRIEIRNEEERVEVQVRAEIEEPDEAVCQVLRDQQIEVIGTFDDTGVLHATTIEIVAEMEIRNRIDFFGTLLEVDCEGRTIQVPFSGGEIRVQLDENTKVISSDGHVVLGQDPCAVLREAVDLRIEIEGKIVNNLVVAIRITILPSAPALFQVRIVGTIDALVVEGVETTGFVLKAENGQLHNVTVDDQTEIRDPNGNPVALNDLSLTLRVRVEGRLDLGATPHPTLAATHIQLLE